MSSSKIELVIGEHTIEDPRGISKLMEDKLDEVKLVGNHKLVLGKAVGGRRGKGIVVSDVQSTAGFVIMKIQGEGTSRYECKLSVPAGEEIRYAEALREVEDRRHKKNRIKRELKRRGNNDSDSDQSKSLEIVEGYLGDESTVACVLLVLFETQDWVNGPELLERECAEVIRNDGVITCSEDAMPVLLHRLAEEGWLSSDEPTKAGESPMYSVSAQGKELLAKHGYDHRKMQDRKRIRIIEQWAGLVRQHEADELRLAEIVPEISQVRERLAALLEEEKGLLARRELPEYKIARQKLEAVDGIVFA